MPKSEIVRKAKKKKLIRELISFAKFLTFMGVVGAILILYKNDNIDFLEIKDNTLGFITDTLNSFRDVKENQHPISNEKVAKTANKKVVCVDPTQIKKTNLISNEKTAKTAKSSQKSANYTEIKKKKIPRKVQYVSDDDIVSDEIAVTAERPFQYGLANRVDDYSWNINIEPYEISEDIRKLCYTKSKRKNTPFKKLKPNKSRNGVVKSWIYKTDDLSYNNNLIILSPNFKIKGTKSLSNEWSEKVTITSNKIIGGFLNEIPYKLVPSNILKNEIKAPSFSKELQLSLTYAPELAVSFAEIDLLLSEPNKIQNKIERLAFAYFRAGKKEKLDSLLTQKMNFVYPEIDWGILKDYVFDSSFGIDSAFNKVKKKNLNPWQFASYKQNQQKFLQFKKNVTLRKQRDFYLKLIRGENILAKSYGKELEKSSKFSKNHKKYIKMLYGKYNNTIAFGVKEKKLEDLNNYFDVIKKRIKEMSLKVSDRYKGFTDKEVKDELKHLTKVLGTFSFFTADIALYILHERKISDYIIAPQSLLYVTVQIAREYEQKYRTVAMLYWMQKTGMNSIQTKPASLNHDHFSAMEATIYLYKYLTYKEYKYFCKDENYKHLKKLMDNSIKLAHDPLSEKYFNALWNHRFMVIKYFWMTNRRCLKRYENIKSAQFIIDANKRKIISQYNDFSKYQLANCYLYSQYPNYQQAKILYLEMLHGINYKDSQPSSQCYELLQIAKITKDKDLWDETQKEAKKYLRLEKSIYNRKRLEKIIQSKFNQPYANIK